MAFWAEKPENKSALEPDSQGFLFGIPSRYSEVTCNFWGARVSKETARILIFARAPSSASFQGLESTEVG